MLLDLTKMRGARDRVERTYDAAAFETSEDFRVAAPVQLVVDVSKKNDEFRLTGRATTRLELTCGRCLEPLMFPLAADFDVLYLPHTRNTGQGEIEIEEDEDLSVAYYRDEVIDLGQLLREQFYLALPMKPLCSDACQGLCPVCGTNLNQATCSCKTGWEDPRWSGLEALREPKREN